MFLQHYDNYLRFFPVPRFLEIRAMGLDLSDDSIRVMDLAKTNTGFIPRKYAERNLRSSSIATNRDEIKKALISLRQEMGMTFVRASLPEEKAYLFKTEIPVVLPSEMIEAVSYTIEENAPVSLSEIVFDYHIIGGQEQKNHIDVAVSVLPKILVDEYITLFEESGISAISFEIEAQAIARAVLPSNHMQPAMVIHIGDTKTGITIVSGGAVQFTTTIPVGGNVFTNIIKEEFKIDALEAQKIKLEKDFVRNNESPNVHRVFIETLTLLKDEINKHTMYWTTHRSKGFDGSQRISTIYISGRDACMPGFLDYMRANLNGEVSIANVWQNCFSSDTYIPQIIRTDSFEYAPSVGLILPK